MSLVELLATQIDDKLNSICIIWSAAHQFNALISLKEFLGFEEKKSLIINSYFIASFNCCPLVKMFSSA